MAAAACLRNASKTKSCPSRTSRMATNTSPGCSERVSSENPVIGADAAPSAAAPDTASKSLQVHSGSVMELTPQCLTDLIMVGKREHLVADDLTGFMAL